MTEIKQRELLDKLLLAMPGADQLAGKLIGKFRLESYLGRTSVAHVYRAIQEGADEYAAVNLFPNQFLKDRTFVERFSMQAGLVAELHNPHILPVLDYGVQEGYPYMTTMYVAGPSLKDLIRTTSQRMLRIPTDAGVFIINSVGRALEYAHGLGMTHGDVKDTNVVLAQSGEVMLTDFRFFNFLTTYKPGAKQISGQMLDGDYQQHEEEKAQDMFAFGVVAYQIITGKYPYPERLDDVRWLQKNIAQVQIQQPSQLVPELPEVIEKALMTVLGKDKTVRYTSVEDFLRGISAYSQQVKTTILPSANISDVVAFSGRFSKAGIPSEFSSEQKKVAIYFLDTGQVIDLEPGREYTLGRSYPKQPIVPDIDLSPFKGYEWGISRLHATMKVGKESVDIIDNDSSNGTYHAGRRIPGQTPYTLQNGDIVMLGKLRLQILVSEE